jgi:hypothetical protein
VARSKTKREIMWNLGSQVSKELWTKIRGQVIKDKLLDKVAKRLDIKIIHQVRTEITNQVRIQLFARIKVRVYNQIK